MLSAADTFQGGTYFQQLLVATQQHRHGHHEVLLRNVLHAVDFVATQKQNVQQMPPDCGRPPKSMQLRITAEPQDIGHNRVFVGGQCTGDVAAKSQQCRAVPQQCRNHGVKARMLVAKMVQCCAGVLDQGVHAGKSIRQRVPT